MLCFSRNLSFMQRLQKYLPLSFIKKNATIFMMVILRTYCRCYGSSSPVHGELPLTPPSRAGIARDRSFMLEKLGQNAIWSKTPQVPVFRTEIVIRHPQPKRLASETEIEGEERVFARTEFLEGSLPL